MLSKSYPCYLYLCVVLDGNFCKVVKHWLVKGKCMGKFVIISGAISFSKSCPGFLLNLCLCPHLLDCKCEWFQLLLCSFWEKLTNKIDVFERIRYSFNVHML